MLSCFFEVILFFAYSVRFDDSAQIEAMSWILSHRDLQKLILFQPVELKARPDPQKSLLAENWFNSRMMKGGLYAFL